MLDHIGVIVAIAAQVLGFVIWLVRLEGRLNFVERVQVLCADEIKTLTIKHENLDSKIVNELSRLRESVARIEGLLNANRNKEEIC